MSWIFGGGNSEGQKAAGGAATTPQYNKEEVFQSMREQSNFRIQQQYLQYSTDICMDYCTKKPADRFSAHERGCLSKCTDRFLDASEVVAETMIEYQKRMGK